MSLFGNSREGIAKEDKQSMVNHGKSEETKGRSTFISFQEEIGESCSEQESISGEQEFQVVAVCYWFIKPRIN